MHGIELRVTFISCKSMLPVYLGKEIEILNIPSSVSSLVMYNNVTKPSLNIGSLANKNYKRCFDVHDYYHSWLNAYTLMYEWIKYLGKNI